MRPDLGEVIPREAWTKMGEESYPRPATGIETILLNYIEVPGVGGVGAVRCYLIRCYYAPHVSPYGCRLFTSPFKRH